MTARKWLDAVVYLSSPLHHHVVGKVRPVFICDKLCQQGQFVLQIVPSQVVDLHVDVVLQTADIICKAQAALAHRLHC